MSVKLVVVVKRIANYVALCLNCTCSYCILANGITSFGKRNSVKTIKYYERDMKSLHFVGRKRQIVRKEN